MSLMSLVVFKAASEDEACFLARGKDSSSSPSHVRAVIQYHLLLKRIHRRASYNLSQFTHSVSIPSPTPSSPSPGSCLLKGARVHDRRGDCATCAGPVGISK